MSTLADVILRDTTANRPAAGIAGRLFYSTDDEKLQRDNGASWDDVEPASLTNPMTTAGDIVYSSDGSGTPARLGVGSDGDVLTLASGVPSWAAPAGGGPMIVRGRVNSSGSVVSGTGFSASKTATGKYTITFSPAFPTAPTVVAMLDTGYFNHNGINGAGFTPTTTTAKFAVEDTGIAPGDGGFFFIAVEG